MLGLALASGQVWRLADAAATSPQSSSATGLYFDHVLLIMMENQNINSTYNCGSLCDQFLTPFANSNGLALNYQRVIDGSLPNYFALTMGQINTYPFPGADCSPYQYPANSSWPKYCPQDSVNIADSLENAGLTWKAYVENYPGQGSGTYYSSGGCYLAYQTYDANNADSTFYAADHNPFVYYQDIVNSTSRCAQIVSANTQHNNPETDDVLLSDLNDPTVSAPNFMWLSPDECDQMHHACYPSPTSDNNAAVQQGSDYLSQLIPQVLNSYTFTNERSALFITFDENCAVADPPGCGSTSSIYTVWASYNSQITTPGYESNTSYNHYSFTRTIETNWNLPSLTANDANAEPMSEFFTSSAPVVS